jgi:hypothetical protein
MYINTPIVITLRATKTAVISKGGKTFLKKSTSIFLINRSPLNDKKTSFPYGVIVNSFEKINLTKSQKKKTIKKGIT